MVLFSSAVASRIQLCWYVEQSLCIPQRAQLCCARWLLLLCISQEFQILSSGLANLQIMFWQQSNFMKREKKNTAAFYWSAGNICPD